MSNNLKHKKGAAVLAMSALIGTAVATTGCRSSLSIQYQDSSESTKKIVEYLKTKPYKYNTSEAGFPNYLATARTRIKEAEEIISPESDRAQASTFKEGEKGYLITSLEDEIKKLKDTSPTGANRPEVAAVIGGDDDKGRYLFDYIVKDSTAPYGIKYDFRTYYFEVENYSRIIFYLHGGAYFKNISEKHLASCYDLAHLLNAKVYMPLYPIGPLYDANDCFQYIDMLYQKIASEEQGKEIIIAGDSAGGGLAISYSQFLFKNRKEVTLPSARILFSPWCDLSMTNNQISSLEDKDVFLSSYGLREIGKIWAGKYDVIDYKISPKYGSFDDKIPTLIFHGSDELLYPDCKETAEKMAKAGTKVRFIVGKGLFHIYPLFRTSPLILPESNEAFEIIKDFITNKN